MRLVLTATVSVLLMLCAKDVHAEVCKSMDIRNDPGHLEKLRNCTVIMGHLHIVLLENVDDENDYSDYSFPNLVEVSDHILVFRVRKLRTLGTLLPNLRVIRGKRLFSNYALVLDHIDHLEEIGLTNLRHISRGGIKIDSCPKLCFGDTVDWEAIGASSLDFRKKASAEFCAHKYCPVDCPGHCWNSQHCQKLPDLEWCHPQCIGCTKHNSLNDCLSCKYFESDGACVQECPKDKITHENLMRCIDKEYCEAMLNRTWWVFKNTCIQSCPFFYERDESNEEGCVWVGEKYKKVCNGSVVETMEILEEMAGCTHISGPLDIRISKNYMEPYLEKNLGSIVSISGYLKIGRSNVIKSLEFFKRLQVIKGEILENNKYALFVFENQNLQRLWNFSEHLNLTIERGQIAFHDNPQLCLSEIEKLTNLTASDKTVFKYSNGNKAVCSMHIDRKVTIVERNPTNVTISWEPLESETHETNVGYVVYYIKAPRGNVTEFASDDTCDADTWESLFVHTNQVQLKSLTPYTRYGYYIKSYSTTHDSQQTPVYYFNTSSTDPSQPTYFTAQAKNETTIVLSWDPPKFPNGKLSYYNITMYLQEDNISLVEQRNYCHHPHVESEEGAWRQVNKLETKISTLDCPCLPQKDYFDFNKDQLCSVLGGNCKNFLYHTDSGTSFGNIHMENMSIHQQHPFHVISYDKVNQTFRQIIKTDVNVNSYEVTNLKHFSVYIFYLMACNEREGTRELCSGPEMVSQRTNKSQTADTVKHVHISVIDKNAYIKWSEPEKINSVIVSYQVEHKRIDLEHAKAISECITRKEYDMIDRSYKLLSLAPGKYAIRVRATSLAGSSNFSTWTFFEIVAPKTTAYWLYALVSVVTLMILALAAYIARYWYRKKYAYDSNHLITSINPDYAGLIYEEDEWEIDRNDIEITKELGQGSFGMVYQGIIKSRQYPCAIKTINDSVTMPSRMEFLNEGAVMKSFNDAHHVIKLLGIVSRGQPPLVVMELMERGDLKSYLRRCREPSQNLTTNELYRMAAEIADGMAYLAAKKFVHRDLAARNCMVAADRTVKIGDFGMARDIYETDYYRKETVGLLPVRWMAPESLADGVFTSDSDVWSYGIVLWEMATLAEQPYQGLSNEEVFHFVKNRGKLERPPECSELMYEVMDACWMWRPNDRPTFADIVDKLATHVGQDFLLVAFCYSRQGKELALNAGPRVYNPPAMTAAPEDDFFGRYDASEEEVNLYAKESNRPTKFLPMSNQRLKKSSPYQISPGSPSSTFSLNSS